MRIDINSDMGESFGAYRIGNDAGLMKSITSANVAAGFHAGDPTVLRDTIRMAKANGVAVGAHPGFPDLVGFGRRELNVTPKEAEDFVLYQVAAVAGVAAAFGWMLDAFDVMLYSMVVAALIQDPELHLSFRAAGILNSVTLIAGALGGIVFGIVADRFGRKRALMTSVLLYSLFTGACGFARTAVELATFRIGLGLGMGGEWASGAALVSESFPAQHRGKALGFMQSAWAIGYGAAAFVNLLVMPRWGWRGVFFVGVLPALLILWVQRSVEEPEIWRARAAAGQKAGRFGDLFTAGLAGVTVALTLMNACTLFAWWGLNSWVPAYLRLPPAQGGVGLASSTMSLFVIAMQVGMWFGYVTFGFIADAIGRKRSYVIYLIVAAILLPMYGILRQPAALLVLGPFVAFFGTGY